MTATKQWSLCRCGCGKLINPGNQFIIIEGRFYLAGHENASLFDSGEIEEPKRDYSKSTSRKLV